MGLTIRGDYLAIFLFFGIGIGINIPMNMPNAQVALNTSLLFRKASTLLPWEAAGRMLCSQLGNRKHLQIIEFLLCWIIAFALLICAVSGIFQYDNLVCQLATTYAQISVITRIIAYAIDFASANKKLGSLPSWIILHHAGVMALHLLTAFYFSHSCSIRMIIYMIALQSSHNTWTKKYSLTLYWENVSLGMLTSFVYITLKILEEERNFLPSLVGVLAHGAVILGVIQLFTESKHQVLI